MCELNRMKIYRLQPILLHRKPTLKNILENISCAWLKIEDKTPSVSKYRGKKFSVTLKACIGEL